MSKIFIIGLPRTGTTSISVALLEMGFLVAHTAFTKKAFEVAEVISDAPCFSDYRHLDELFPNSKFIYLSRKLDEWVPSITMLLGKMAPHLEPKTGRFNPVLKRSFQHVFSSTLPLSNNQLVDCYTRHERAVKTYFSNRDDLLAIDISEQGSLQKLQRFLSVEVEGLNVPGLNVHGLDVEAVQVEAVQVEGSESELIVGIDRKDKIERKPLEHLAFPKLNVGRNVASWHEYKHPNKVNSNLAGVEHRKYFDYEFLGYE